jgi:hypothetical protein
MTRRTFAKAGKIASAAAHNKQSANNAPMPGKQEGKPITQGLQPAQARENKAPRLAHVVALTVARRGVVNLEKKSSRAR